MKETACPCSCQIRALQFFFLTLVCLMLPTANSFGSTIPKEAWDRPNAPEQFGVRSIQYEFLQNPDFTAGSLDAQPWSDSYWPYFEIGAAWRWLAPDKTPAFSFTADTTGPQNPDDAQEYQENWRRYRQAVNKDIERNLSDARAMAALPWQERLYVSPAEKYDEATADKDFGLTRHDLNDFAVNRKYYENQGLSWSWMGYCNGWSAAALLYSKPEHGVLMTNTERQNKTLFTVGDIRGLISRAASENPLSSAATMLGTRCDLPSDDVIVNENGRPVDAALGTYDLSSRSFKNPANLTVVSTNWYGEARKDPSAIRMLVRFGSPPPNDSLHQSLYYIEAVSNSWVQPSNGPQERILAIRLYSTFLGTDGQLYLNQVLVSPFADEVGRFASGDGRFRTRNGTYVTDRHEALAALAKLVGVDIASLDPTAYANLKYIKTCRDVNAGSFHLALARFLSKAGSGDLGAQGFVMDGSTFDQVWNFPVYAFNSKIGKPTALSYTDARGQTIEDPDRAWRAPNTKQIVDVYTQVFMAVENGPLAVYEKADEVSTSLIYHYTLELDASGYVIGGEWHRSANGNDWQSVKPLAGIDLLQQLKTGKQNYLISGAPDFLWRYEPGTRILDGRLLKADFIERLHACSVAQTAPLQTIDVAGTKVPYSLCTYP